MILLLFFLSIAYFSSSSSINCHSGLTSGSFVSQISSKNSILCDASVHWCISHFYNSDPPNVFFNSCDQRGECETKNIFNGCVLSATEMTCCCNTLNCNNYTTRPPVPNRSCYFGVVGNLTAQKCNNNWCHSFAMNNNSTNETFMHECDRWGACQKIQNGCVKTETSWECCCDSDDCNEWTIPPNPQPIVCSTSDYINQSVNCTTGWCYDLLSSNNSLSHGCDDSGQCSGLGNCCSASSEGTICCCNANMCNGAPITTPPQNQITTESDTSAAPTIAMSTLITTTEMNSTETLTEATATAADTTTTVMTTTTTMAATLPMKSFTVNLLTVFVLMRRFEI